MQSTPGQQFEIAAVAVIQYWPPGPNRTTTKKCKSVININMQMDVPLPHHRIN